MNPLEPPLRAYGPVYSNAWCGYRYCWKCWGIDRTWTKSTSICNLLVIVCGSYMQCIFMHWSMLKCFRPISDGQREGNSAALGLSVQGEEWETCSAVAYHKCQVSFIDCIHNTQLMYKYYKSGEFRWHACIPQYSHYKCYWVYYLQFTTQTVICGSPR